MGRAPDFEARSLEIRQEMDDLRHQRERMFRILIAAVLLGFLMVVGTVIWVAG